MPLFNLSLIYENYFTYFGALILYHPTLPFEMFLSGIWIFLNTRACLLRIVTILISLQPPAGSFPTLCFLLSQSNSSPCYLGLQSPLSCSDTIPKQVILPRPPEWHRPGVLKQHPFLRISLTTLDCLLCLLTSIQKCSSVLYIGRCQIDTPVHRAR